MVLRHNAQIGKCAEQSQDGAWESNAIFLKSSDCPPHFGFSFITCISSVLGYPLKKR